MKQLTLSLLTIALTVIIPASNALAQTSTTQAPAGEQQQKRTRIGTALAVWQEPLRLASVSGQTDNSVAGFKGVLLTLERIARRPWGGYALAGAVGGVAASGGGTSSVVDYKKGSLASTLILLQPKLVYAFSDRVSIAIGAAAMYRTIQWPSTATVQVASGRDYGALLTFDIALGLTENLDFRQTYGVGSLEAGGYWQWGLSYAL